MVELCPIPGMVSPNFVAARLVYKLLTYKFGLAVVARYSNSDDAQPIAARR